MFRIYNNTIYLHVRIYSVQFSTICGCSCSEVVFVCIPFRFCCFPYSFHNTEEVVVEVVVCILLGHNLGFKNK